MKYEMLAHALFYACWLAIKVVIEWPNNKTDLYNELEVTLFVIRCDGRVRSGHKFVINGGT